jgi:hypothetical protein
MDHATDFFRHEIAFFCCPLNCFCLSSKTQYLAHQIQSQPIVRRSPLKGQLLETLTDLGSPNRANIPRPEPRGGNRLLRKVMLVFQHIKRITEITSCLVSTHFCHNGLESGIWKRPQLSERIGRTERSSGRSYPCETALSLPLHRLPECDATRTNHLRALLEMAAREWLEQKGKQRTTAG